MLSSGDKTGGRICNALSEGLRWFPEKVNDRYRVMILLTGGADKGEGKGSCVQDSFEGGLVPEDDYFVTRKLALVQNPFQNFCGLWRECFGLDFLI